MHSPIAEVRQQNEHEAKHLFARLREALADVERIMESIIERKAWLTLGYGSFLEAWQSEMGDTRISSERALARVLYAMYAEGATPDEVAYAVSGVGTKAETVHEQYEAGVPVGAVTTVRRHTRRLDKAPPSTVHVPVKPEDYTRWELAAARKRSTLKAEAERALRAWFDG